MFFYASEITNLIDESKNLSEREGCLSEQTQMSKKISLSIRYYTYSGSDSFLIIPAQESDW